MFALTVCVVSATPGPNMLLAMTHGIHYGVKYTLTTCLGLMTALAVIMLVSAAGLGALLATSTFVFSLIKYIGTAYLIYLGIRTWRAIPRSIEEKSARDTHYPAASHRFYTGFLVAISNPKAFLFFVALFPQFMDTTQPEKPQLILLAVTFFVIEAGWQFVYASGGARLARWLNTAHRLKWVNRLCGSAFVSAGIVLSSVSRTP